MAQMSINAFMLIDTAIHHRKFRLHRVIQIPACPLRKLWQLRPRILQEVRRLAVCLQRRLIFVSFVDEELARSFLMAMHLEHQAPRLFAGFLGQRAEDSFGLRLLTRFCPPYDREDDHLCAGWANISSLRLFICSGVTSSICCAI